MAKITVRVLDKPRPTSKRKPCGCKDIKAIAQASAEIVGGG
jgi:hypothetical protein